MTTEARKTHSSEYSTVTTVVMVALTLLVSVPIMWLIGAFATFSYGLGLWIVPYLGSQLSLQFFADRGADAYRSAISVFAALAALQNTALVFWYLRKAGASKLLDLVLHLLLGLTILGVLAGFLLLLAL